MFALESRNIAFNTNIAFGIFTSIINHGTTSNIAKWSDRTMMLVGIFTDICVIESMHLPPYFLTDPMFPEDKSSLYLKPNPYLSSNWESDLYYYICYYFLSLSILSFIISKWIESIVKRHYTQINEHGIYHKSLLNLILSCHITSHVLLTITHVLMLYHSI